MTEEKTCIICHQLKPISAFYKTSKAGTKHMNTCISCYSSKQRAYYKQHPEKFLNISTRIKNRGISPIPHYKPSTPYSHKKSLDTILNEYLTYLNDNKEE